MEDVSFGTIRGDERDSTVKNGNSFFQNYEANQFSEMIKSDQSLFAQFFPSLQITDFDYW